MVCVILAGKQEGWYNWISW